MKRLKNFWAVIIMAIIATATTMQSCSKSEEHDAQTCVYQIQLDNSRNQNTMGFLKNSPEWNKIVNACSQYAGASDQGLFSVSGSTPADCDAKAKEKCRVIEKRLRSDGYTIKIAFIVYNKSQNGNVVTRINMN